MAWGTNHGTMEVFKCNKFHLNWFAWVDQRKLCIDWRPMVGDTSKLPPVDDSLEPFRDQLCKASVDIGVISLAEIVARQGLDWVQFEDEPFLLPLLEWRRSKCSW